MVIQPLVEGHGEMDAVPVLLRRLQEQAGTYGFQIARPIRRPRADLVREESVRLWVRIALGEPDCTGVIIVFDGDDDPVCELGPQVKAWAQAEARNVPCEVVIAKREYEAWFISAIESLRGARGIAVDAVSHPDPEGVRDAKGELEARMQGSFYSATADQAALTARVDLREVHRKCRSFRKMTKAFGLLAEATGSVLKAWPPEGWLAG